MVLIQIVIRTERVQLQCIS